MSDGPEQTIEELLATSTAPASIPFHLKGFADEKTDWGSGQPIVFSQCWPLSADDWDVQMLFFQSYGFRLIAHDRRGHGRSSQVGSGHGMNHYADDLAALVASHGYRLEEPGAHCDIAKRE